jgi:hypothetical protein
MYLNPWDSFSSLFLVTVDALLFVWVKSTNFPYLNTIFFCDAVMAFYIGYMQ